MPTCPVLEMTFICAHALSTRPLVLPDSHAISIRISRCGGDVLLLVDGQTGEPLAEGDVVRISRARQGVTFIHLPGYSHFSVLRQKLHWRGSNM